MEAVLAQIRPALEEREQRSLGRLVFHPVGSGCINQTGFITDPESGYRAFLKLHRADRLPNFEAETAGLEEIMATETIRVPRPLLHGATDAHAFLVLQALDLQSPRDRVAAEEHLGRDLAALHRVRGKRFGWNRHNVIGDTPQINTEEDHWVAFYREHRLRYQVDLAARKGLQLPRATALLDSLDAFFSHYQPGPSLLHGDLWTGNIAFDEEARPVLYDPAVYFGDRETDIAFTEMFGGLSPAFYRAYHEAYPMDSGYEKRRDLYNLYHILNHYNLFGGYYGIQAQETIRSLLSITGAK